MEGIALGTVVVATVMSTMMFLRRTDGRFRAPIATLAVTVVTLMVSVLGNLMPEVLELLGRERSQLLAGQWWRLVTPLFVQDGGWLGTIFNISALIVIGLCAETLHRRRTFLTVYFGAGIVSEVFAYTLMPHQGFAGNSVATLGAAGLCVVTICLVRPLTARVLALIGLLAGGLLVVTGNLHGVGFAVGVLIGLAAIVWLRRFSAAGDRESLG